MRRLAAAFITVATFFSCNKDTNTFTLEGTAEGFADGTEVLVYTLDTNQPKVIDTLTIQNGSFTGTYEKSQEARLNYLRVGDATVLYFPENEDLNAVIYKDSVQASYVSGGKQNEAFRAFNKQLRDFNKEKQVQLEKFQEAQKVQDNVTMAKLQQDNQALVARERQFKKDFITNNSNSIFSIMLISEMLNRKEMTPSEAEEAIANLAPKIANLEITSQVKTVLSNLKKADIGSVAPDFSAPSPDGDMLSLKETMGKYTIIDFWASWCRPCRMENPNVVKVYNEYHDKGLNIISVSLDKQGQKDRWLKAIEDDKMDWYHVSNLQFWDDPIARQYNVRSIPATFLLDEQGRIIAKNLRGPALGAKMEELLGN
jgi:thiol-disulfide isomerase/thioredoxin